jgi:hypothetical protein
MVECCQYNFVPHIGRKGSCISKEKFSQKQLLYLFEKKLKEGCVYKLSYFAVAPCVGAYRPTLHPYKLIFQMKSKVQTCESPKIPLFGFPFTDLAVVSGYSYDYDYLIGNVYL